MPKFHIFLTIAVLVCGAFAQGQTMRDPDSLYSPTAARKFYELARRASADERPGNIAQARLFYEALIQLDSQPNYAMENMLEFFSGDYSRDNSQAVSRLLRRYIDSSANIDVAQRAIGYLLAHRDTREQRQRLLSDLYSEISGSNSRLESLILTRLADMAAQEADFDTAQHYYMQAYDRFSYNADAFQSMLNLSQGQVNAAVHLEHLRRQLLVNPFDIDAGLRFAGRAFSLQLYDEATQAYDYCARLWQWARADQPLPQRIYLPWALSAYHSGADVGPIVRRAQQQDRFDFRLEVIAGLAQADADRAQEIFDNAVAKAKEQIAQQMNLDVQITDLAWFYCFVVPEAGEAVNWANRAYSHEPDAVAGALLAYALAMNGQGSYALELADEHSDLQIGKVALGRIKLEQDQTQEGIETLRAAVAMQPGSIAAARAKQLLEQHDSRYRPEVDAGLLRTTLQGRVGRPVVPRFAEPDQLVRIELKIAGNEFPYGRRFDANLAITNLGSQELVISDQSMIAGRFRIDAAVAGDIEKDIPQVFDRRIVPSEPIRPGQTLLVPVELLTGRLESLCAKHPQASLDITFRVYTDPQDSSEPENSLSGLEPAVASIRRVKTELRASFLQNRLGALAQGRQNQKINIAALFVGLLGEQQQLSLSDRPSYNIRYADWMPSMLSSAVAGNLTDTSWVTRLCTLADLVGLELDYELVDAAAENLGHEAWPVRMAALKVLHSSQGENFRVVLESYAESDRHELVRQLAANLSERAD